MDGGLVSMDVVRGYAGCDVTCGYFVNRSE